MNLLDNKDETELMKTNFTYPEPNDPDIQYKLYKKREFYYNKYPEQPEIKTYQDIKDYRDNICAKDFSLHEYQTLLANLFLRITTIGICVGFFTATSFNVFNVLIFAP